MAEVLPFFSLGGILMATLTLIQFSPRSVISRLASLYRRHSWFLQDKNRGKKTGRLRSETEKDEKCYDDTAVSQEMGGYSSSPFFSFLFYKCNRRAVCAPFFFFNVKNRPKSCYKTSGCLYCLEWQQHMSLPLHSGSSVKMGNVFSHTLRADRHLSATWC